MSGCKEPCFRATKPSRQMHGGATGRARAIGLTDSVKNRWFLGDESSPLEKALCWNRLSSTPTLKKMLENKEGHHSTQTWVAPKKLAACEAGA